MDNDFWYKLIQININTDDKDIIDTINTLFDNKTFDNINLIKNCDTKYNEKSQDNSDDEEILSVLSNIARSTLGNIETASNDITFSKLNQLSKAFDMSLSEFLNF